MELRLNSAKTVTDSLPFAVEPIDTYAVVGVGLFRNLEHIFRSGVMKLYGQRIGREDVVGDVPYVVALAMSVINIKAIRTTVCLFI